MERYITDEKVAELLAVSRSTVRQWRRDGQGPPYHRIGVWAVRYLVDEVMEWASSRKVVPEESVEALTDDRT